MAQKDIEVYAGILKESEAWETEQAVTARRAARAA